jgi:hypothetical protein
MRTAKDVAAAVQLGQLDDILRLAGERRDVVFNPRRSAVQVVACASGFVVAHFELRPQQFALLVRSLDRALATTLSDRWAEFERSSAEKGLLSLEPR